ncbi:IS200/IS605 family transposase [Kiritimatiellota bacterium B12222]|nr:IS200/IS605 family transposase [Kiritimatiellota bacterium B12222]
MSQSISENILHLVFSTKHRENRLHSSIRSELFAMMASVTERNKCHAYRVGGVDDHVHLAFHLHPTLSLSRYVNLLKTESSKWLKTTSGIENSFAWQSGYGAFSISRAHLPALCEYLEHQESHHHRESFKDEFRRVCEKHNVQIDERYVWD